MVRVELRKALALRSQIRRADQIIERNFPVSELCQIHRPPSETSSSQTLLRRFQKPLNSFQWCPMVLHNARRFVTLKSTGPRGPWGFESLASATSQALTPHSIS
jgi:hypothetical protein